MYTSLNCLTIGDLHGRACWKSAAPEWVKRSLVHQVIFLGDYVDSFDISLADQAENLRELIALKQEYPTQVILLLGNHDAHYLWPDAPRGSGFKPVNHAQLFPIFQEHRALFQVAYERHFNGQKYLWTHAGVSDAWTLEMPTIDYPCAALRQPTLADALNFLTESTRYRDMLLQVGAARGGMTNGGPLWADMKELMKPIGGYHQIVGHTALERPGARTADAKGIGDTSVTFCDYNEFTLGLDNVRSNFFYQL